MGLGIAELCFPDSISEVHDHESLHVLSVMDAAAILMAMANSGADYHECNRKRKRTPETRKQRMKKIEFPFASTTMRDHNISFYYDGADQGNRKRNKKPSPAAATKKEKKKTESPLIPETPTGIRDEMEKISGNSDHEKNRKRKRGPASVSAPATKKQRKKKTESPSISEMPAAMRERIEEMGGYRIELVIEKQLHDTDLNKNHGRLSLPPRMVKTNFVTEEEKKLLSQNEGKKKKGMNVMIIDEVIGESMICLKKWKIGSDETYCLMTQWNSFVKQTGLTTEDSIQLWSFRKDSFDSEKEAIVSTLCFAMVKLVDDNEQKVEDK